MITQFSNYNVSDMDLFLEGLNVLVEKIFAFNFDILTYNMDNNYHVFTISKLTDDEHIIIER